MEVNHSQASSNRIRPSYTFQSAEELISCASWKRKKDKPLYLARPILRTIPSLAVEPKIMIIPTPKATRPSPKIHKQIAQI